MDKMKWALVPCLFLAMVADGLAAEYLDNTTDMPIPYAPASSTEDVFGMFSNPAGLGMVSDVQLGFVHGEFPDTFGRGDAFALQLGALGLGVQYVRPHRALWADDYVKYSIPLGVPLGDHAALGFGLDVLDPSGDSNGVAVGWTTGVMLRPVRFVSLGVTTGNLGNPGPFGHRLERQLTLGLGLRPLGDALTLSGDLHLAEGARSPPAEFHARLELVRGLNLFSRVTTEAAFSVGLALDFLHFGAAAAPYFSDDGGYSGVSYLARISASRYPSLVEVPNRVVVFHLNQGLQKRSRTGLDILGLGERGVLDLVTEIERAGSDPSVAAILLFVEDNPLSLEEADEVARALNAFRAGGKKVFASAGAIDTKDYLLATAADGVFMSPGGHVFVGGLKGELTYFAGTLEKLDVRVQAARAGKYKSFPEKFTRDGPSPESLEQVRAMVADFQEELVARISGARGISRKDVEAILDRGFMTPEEARDARLVDAVIHRADIETEIERRLGRRAELSEDFFDTERRRTSWRAPPRIALLRIDGTIVHGEGSSGIFGTGSTGNAEICEAAEAIAQDPQVRAVVLRIDSGGGSGIASEIIWRCMKDLKKEKPLVVSMGSAAASGGYYAAVPASHIFADPFTVTGSIGVWGLKINIAGLAKKLGITHQTVKLTKGADFDGVWRDLDPDEQKRFQRYVDGFYSQFALRVAEGRGLSMDAVEKAAQGRVWSAKAAIQARLVDEIGGVRDAINKAKKLSGIDAAEQVVIEIHPERPSMLRAVGKRLLIYADPLGALRNEIKAETRADPRAELPYDIEIR
ncbi:MAG: signal peptide peptidase SppA [Deltaproteobacteria bacterium]|nr:signal peptide peptidase SppA [Deltaproteobacteria bacterium]